MRADKTTRGAEYGHEKCLKQAKSTLQEAEAMLAQRWAVPVGMGDTVGREMGNGTWRVACGTGGPGGEDHPPIGAPRSPHPLSYIPLGARLVAAAPRCPSGRGEHRHASVGLDAVHPRA